MKANLKDYNLKKDLNNKKKIFNAKIVKNIQISESYYQIDFEINENIDFYPGQFVNILVNTSSNNILSNNNNSFDPLLRRPFSVYNFKNNILSILYQVIGKGTKILTLKQKGEYLNIIGPLGNQFSNPFENEDNDKNKFDDNNEFHNTEYFLYVAGGIGIAPILFKSRKDNEIFTKIKNNKKTIFKNVNIFKNIKYKRVLFYGSRDLKDFVNPEIYEDLFDEIYLSFDIEYDLKKINKYFKNIINKNKIYIFFNTNIVEVIRIYLTKELLKKDIDSFFKAGYELKDFKKDDSEDKYNEYNKNKDKLNNNKLNNNKLTNNKLINNKYKNKYNNKFNNNKINNNKINNYIYINIRNNIKIFNFNEIKKDSVKIDSVNYKFNKFFYSYLCGPKNMIKSYYENIENNDKFKIYININTEVSMEEYMACGFHACLGCAIETVDNGYLYVCHDGPVFNLKKIKF